MDLATKTDAMNTIIIKAIDDHLRSSGSSSESNMNVAAEPAITARATRIQNSLSSFLLDTTDSASVSMRSLGLGRGSDLSVMGFSVSGTSFAGEAGSASASRISAAPASFVPVSFVPVSVTDSFASAPFLLEASGVGLDFRFLNFAN